MVRTDSSLMVEVPLLASLWLVSAVSYRYSKVFLSNHEIVSNNAVLMRWNFWGPCTTYLDIMFNFYQCKFHEIWYIFFSTSEYWMLHVLIDQEIWSVFFPLQNIGAYRRFSEENWNGVEGTSEIMSLGTCWELLFSGELKEN